MNVVKGSGSGAHYFFSGFNLIQTPGLRKFVVVPLTVNFIIFSFFFYYLVVSVAEWMESFKTWLTSSLPDALQAFIGYLDFLLWPLIILFILVVFSFIFATVSNWLASPFNGLLAEKVEQYLSGESLNETGFSDIIKDIPRLLWREWRKLGYFIPRALGCLVLFLIPLVGQSIAPLVWFLFSAWMMAIQYCDYPFDNHKIPFDSMKQLLKQQRGQSMSFGIMAMLFTMIPIVNILVMPVAICGATAMWVQTQKQIALGRAPR